MRTTPTVKGMTNMDYYYRVLLPFVRRLIRNNHEVTEDGYALNANVLCGTDLSEFAMHLFEYYDRSLDFLYDTDNFSSALIKLLRNDNQTCQLDLSMVIRDEMITHFLPEMQRLIDENISDVESEDYTSQGFISIQDRQTGESRWERRL
jgi:hypothetical protein